MTGVPLYIQAAPLDPAFTGTPQAFFDALIRRMRIVSPDGFYGVVVSDTEPSSNQGIWLRNGTQIYVWSNVDRKYVPADITDSLRDVYTAITGLLSRITTLEGKLASGRIIYSQTAPVEADRVNVLWVQTDTDNRVLEVKSWDSTVGEWVPANIAANFELTGGVVNAYTIRLNSPNSMSEIKGRHLSIQFHVGCSAPGTLQVIGFDPVPMKKHKDEDLETGDFKSNQITSVWFDGQVFQIVSTKAATIPPIPVTPNCEYKFITIPIVPTLGDEDAVLNFGPALNEIPHGMVGAPTVVIAKFVTLVYLQGGGYNVNGASNVSESNAVDIYPGAHILLANVVRTDIFTFNDLTHTIPVPSPMFYIGWDQTRIGLINIPKSGNDLTHPKFIIGVVGTPREVGDDRHAGVSYGLKVTSGSGYSHGDPVFNLELHCFRYYV